jgi:hypothetical protein
MRGGRWNRRRVSDVRTFLPSTYGAFPSMHFSCCILAVTSSDLPPSTISSLSVHHQTTISRPSAGRHEQEMAHGCWDLGSSLSAHSVVLRRRPPNALAGQAGAVDKISLTAKRFPVVEMAGHPDGMDKVVGTSVRPAQTRNKRSYHRRFWCQFSASETPPGSSGSGE